MTEITPEQQNITPEQPKIYQLRAFSTKTTSDKRLTLRRRASSDSDGFTSDQASATLKFILQTSERTVAMSQTYYDVEALESLLEERERDLELAARIGQTLLEKNRQLVEQIGELEHALGSAHEENIQLKHSIQSKEELLKSVGDEQLSGESTPSVSGRIFRGGYTVQEHINQLDERIYRLQDENQSLRSEIHETIEKLQSKETEYHDIVDGSVKDLNTVSKRLIFFRQELHSKTAECFEQQEQITRLLAQLVDTQREKKVKSLEAEENLNAFEESQQTQTFLVAEFHELEKRYLETVRMLEENQVGDFGQSFDTQGYSSLDKELADITTPLSNMGRPPSPDRHIRSLPQPVQDRKKGMNQTRNESGFVETSHDRDMLTSTLAHFAQDEHVNLNNSLAEVHCGIPLQFSQSRIVPDPIATPPNPPIDSGAMSPVLSLCGRSPIGSSVFSSGINTPLVGKSGVPGSRDLERALNRLAIRRQVENQISEKRRSKALTYKEKIKNDEYDNYNVPRKVERLRIIKPMAGSQVMQQWRQMTQVDLDTAVSQELTHI